MFVTRERLLELINALDEARRSAVEGTKLYCLKKREDEEGNVTRTETRKKRNGQVEEFEVPLGVHGRGFLGIDVKTGAVKCGECIKKGK